MFKFGLMLTSRVAVTAGWTASGARLVTRPPRLQARLRGARWARRAAVLRDLRCSSTHAQKVRTSWGGATAGGSKRSDAVLMMMLVTCKPPPHLLLSPPKGQTLHYCVNRQRHN